jgi:hypothetical protein
MSFKYNERDKKTVSPVFNWVYWNPIVISVCRQKCGTKIITIYGVYCLNPSYRIHLYLYDWVTTNWRRDIRTKNLVEQFETIARSFIRSVCVQRNQQECGVVENSVVRCLDWTCQLFTTSL